MLRGPVFRKSSTGFFLEPSIPYTSEASKTENVKKSLKGASVDQAVFTIQSSILNKMSYDAASNRTGFTDPENGSTSYAYDPLNRLQPLTPPAAFTATGISASPMTR
jgi:hypothetical protein